MGNIVLRLFGPLIVIILLSCNAEEVDQASIGVVQEKLVVNGIIENLSDTLYFQLSSSEYAYNAEFPEKLDTADMEVKINGNLQPVNFDPFKEKFFATTQTKENDVVEITVKKERFQTIFAKTIIPSSPKNYEVKILEGQGLDSRNEQSDIVQISFIDPPEQKNYYGFKLLYLEQGTNVFRDVIFEKNDMVLLGSDLIEQNDKTFIFSDIGFNGENKVLQIVPESGQGNFNPDVKYLLFFYHLHPDYYRYLASLKSYNEDFGNNDFSPFRLSSGVFTNVSNGLGIWSSQYQSIDTLR